MPSTPQSQRYDRVSIALHWTIGLAIIALAVSALLREPLFAKGSFPREALKAFHEPAGMVVFALIALRLLWRAAHRAPALPDTMTGPERGLAHATHVALYLLMIAIPLVGGVFVLGRGSPIDFGLFQIASPFAAAPFARESLRTLGRAAPDIDDIEIAHQG